MTTVSPGMRILDVGCGAGDVALLAAELVGEAGAVVGIDRSEAAILAARPRAATAKNVHFLVASPDESSNGIDALVLDDYDFYSEVVPIYLGMPYAILSNALHFDYSGYTPLCVYGWAHENTPEARERNRLGVSKFTQMLIRSNTEIIAKVERAGIKPNWEDPSSLLSDRPCITQCPREFDFESSHWPKEFHYAGPFHDGEGRPEILVGVFMNCWRMRSSRSARRTTAAGRLRTVEPAHPEWRDNHQW
jgi:SAM-dependent methyltransferase